MKRLYHRHIEPVLMTLWAITICLSLFLGAAWLIIEVFTSYSLTFCGTDYNGGNNGAGERFCIDEIGVSRQ